MTPKAEQLKKEYHKLWREKNKDHIKEYHQNWRKENPDKVKQADVRYWEKKANER